MIPALANKHILLGVSGGIAAYKSVELCRLLQKVGAHVSVMMTDAAQRFVGKETFAAITHKPVATSLWQDSDAIEHIALADQADVMVVAPATANTIAKMSHGIADNLVSTVHLAFEGPVVIAPAMNVHMWEHAATKANIKCLEDRGYQIVGPGVGEMACGHVGAGRMIELDLIVEAIARALTPKTLEKRRFLISAGGTQEAIDPVRFIGNHASGKMGFALAAEAAHRGAKVHVIAANVDLKTPFAVDRTNVKTAAEMYEHIHNLNDDSDVLIMSAAVADYTTEKLPSKHKKEEGRGLTLNLERTTDILATIGALSKHPFLVGFAAETVENDDELRMLAIEKCKKKGCDILVANDVSSPTIGFRSEENRVLIVNQKEEIRRIEKSHKRIIAASICEEIAAMLSESR